MAALGALARPRRSSGAGQRSGLIQRVPAPETTVARARLGPVQTDAEPEVSGFPRWGVLRGALHQTRDDLLSLKGVFVTAVALGLGNEVFPDMARATLQHRIAHGLVVVASTLALIAFVDLAQRLTLYQPRSRRAWAIAAADHAHLLGFSIDTLPSGGPVPYPVWFVIRKPSGRYIQPLAEEPDLEMRGFYPAGTWAHVVEQPYEHGVYEVRAYLAVPWVELARAEVNVSPPASTASVPALVPGSSVA